MIRLWALTGFLVFSGFLIYLVLNYFRNKPETVDRYEFIDDINSDGESIVRRVDRKDFQVE